VDARTIHRKLQLHGLDKKTFSQNVSEARFRNSFKPQTNH